jgi:hypothetical protein
MIFPAEEYDAGASLQLSISTSQPAHPVCIHEGERQSPLIFQNFEIRSHLGICIVRILMPSHTFVQEVVEVSVNGYLQLSPDQSGLDFLLCNVAVESRSVRAIAQRR